MNLPKKLNGNPSYSAQQDCVNRCPCQAECSKGCHDCPHPICSCKNPSTLPDYQLCEDEVNSKLLECINNCGDDLACVSQCSRQFDQDFNQCPCNEDCPGGCPCPNYECTATTTTAAVTTTAQSSSSSVFILYSHKHSWEWKRPLVTDIRQGSARQLVQFSVQFSVQDFRFNSQLNFQLEIFGSIFGSLFGSTFGSRFSVRDFRLNFRFIFRFNFVLSKLKEVSCRTLI